MPEGPRLGQDGVLESPVKSSRRDQVDRPAEDGSQRVGQRLDLPAEPAARLQLVEHVDVAVWSGGPAGDGTEDAEPSTTRAGRSVEPDVG